MTDFNFRYERLDTKSAAEHSSLSFTDRTSYLEWVASWKVEWHSVVKDIREKKRIRSDKTARDIDRSYAASDRETLRIRAYNLLQVRAAGKALSLRQKDMAAVA